MWFEMCRFLCSCLEFITPLTHVQAYLNVPLPFLDISQFCGRECWFVRERYQSLTRGEARREGSQWEVRQMAGLRHTHDLASAEEDSIILTVKGTSHTHTHRALVSPVGPGCQPPNPERLMLNPDSHSQLNLWGLNIDLDQGQAPIQITLLYIFTMTTP